MIQYNRQPYVYVSSFPCLCPYSSFSFSLFSFCAFLFHLPLVGKIEMTVENLLQLHSEGWQHFGDLTFPKNCLHDQLDQEWKLRRLSIWDATEGDQYLCKLYTRVFWFLFIRSRIDVEKPQLTLPLGTFVPPPAIRFVFLMFFTSHCILRIWTNLQNKLWNIYKNFLASDSSDSKFLASVVPNLLPTLNVYVKIKIFWISLKLYIL